MRHFFGISGATLSGCLALILAAILPAAASHHQRRRTHPKILTAPRPHIHKSSMLSHQVVIADQLVMVIDTAPPGSTPARRVDKINERLIDIIASEPLIPGRMHLATQDGQTVIMVGAHLLTAVTEADARSNGTTVPVLAHFWLANLKRALPQARPVARG